MIRGRRFSEDTGNCYFNKSEKSFVKALASEEFANMMNEGQDLYTFDPAHKLPDGTYTGCTIGINGYDESIYLQYVFDTKGFINCARKELEYALRNDRVPRSVAQAVLDTIVSKLSQTESRKANRSAIREQITKKAKARLNLLNDIVNYAYEYGEDDVKSIFKQAFKKVTGDDLTDALADDEENK